MKKLIKTVAGVNLKDWKKSKKLTNEDIGWIVDVNHRSISAWCVGRYLVYDIKEDDKTVSTLGIYNDDNKFKFSQQYGSCNSKVCEDLVDFAKEILIKLNKEK